MTGLGGMVVISHRLDSMILQLFPNLNDSVIWCYTAASPEQDVFLHKNPHDR